MTKGVDAHGQPLDRSYNWQRLSDSRTDEFIGICRGVLADGSLVCEEAKFILNWLRRNPAVGSSPFGRKIEAALVSALKDDVLGSDDEEELVTLLLSLVGGTPYDGDDASFSTSLPLDDPPPGITFTKSSFCFTGKFAFGTRSACQRAVIELGAIVQNNPSSETSFLVVGEVGSRDWAHSAMGRKIEKAVELRETGANIHIVSEPCWVKTINQIGPSYDAAQRQKNWQIGDLAQQIADCKIRHVGSIVAYTLASHFGSFDVFASATPDQLAAINEIGHITASAIHEFFSGRSSINGAEVHKSVEVGVEISLTKHDPSTLPLANKTIVVTGTFERFDRQQIESLITEKGGKPSGSVSKKASFVVAGESAGSKLDKAKTLGIEIIDEKEFLKRAKLPET